jgi:hypothetical protein
VGRRLTDEERETRSGRGIGAKRLWPVALVVVAIFIVALDIPTLERCAGRLADGRGRAGAAVRAVLAYPCSPFLLRGSWGEWLLFAALWVPIPFAVLNWFWAKRHEAYWDIIRLREKKRRAEKRAKKREG